MASMNPTVVAKPDPSVSQVEADRLAVMAGQSGREDVRQAIGARISSPDNQSTLGEQARSATSNSVGFGEKVRAAAWEGGKGVAIGAVSAANPVAGRALYAADRMGMIDKAVGMKRQSMAMHKRDFEGLQSGGSSARDADGQSVGDAEFREPNRPGGPAPQ